MVSSRWVLGSSTGIRLFSVRNTIIQPASTRMNGPVARVMANPGEASMPDRERLPLALARAAKPRNSAGSVSTEKVTSRAAPMPSKLDPVSRAETTVANRARPNR